MKPDWDKLSKKFEGHKDVLIADVDCTAEGKSLCEEIGVRGYPTIKHGDPSDLQDYKGGRDFAALSKFADSLGPVCSPSNLDLCSDEKKKQIQDFMAMDAKAREAKIKQSEETVEKLEEDFKAFVEGLQKSYETANEKKDADVQAVKESGLGLLKAVHNAAKKEGGKSEL